MAMKSEAEPLGMPSASELRALLDAEGLMESPQPQPLGWQGILHSVVDPAPPPLQLMGWEARSACAARCGFEVLRRASGETADEFRLRLHYAWGGIGQVAYLLYPRGTK